VIEIKPGKNTKIIVDFTFFAALALFFYFDESRFGIMGICACIIHEMGHLAALFAEKRDFESLTFYGGGIKIKYNEKADASVMLIMAGSLLNFIIFIVLYFAFPFNFSLRIFAVINLIIGGFNLLPLRFFDGGRLMEKALIKFLSAEKALETARKAEQFIAVIAVILSILIIIFGELNTSVLIVVIYVLISDIMAKMK
jgi:Zn-dependent protease